LFKTIFLFDSTYVTGAVKKAPVNIQRSIEQRQDQNVRTQRPWRRLQSLYMTVRQKQKYGWRMCSYDIITSRS